MKFFCLVVALLTILLPCRGQETLGNLLQSNGIPQIKFTQAELAEGINGAAASKDGVTYAVYLKVEGEMLTGEPEVVRYDQKTGSVLRSSIKTGDEDQCCGSPDGIEFVDDDLVLPFEYNPSAGTLLILNRNLQLVEIMYGFGVTRIAPLQIVLTEGMMHFAPIHAERLQFVDLNSGAAKELYPPMNDALRVAFNKKNKELLPPDNICRLSDNDYCDPAMYDEGIKVVGTDGDGRFALVAGWNSSHVIKKGDDPVTIASESILYLYEKGKNGWLYCERELSDSEADALTSGSTNYYQTVKASCKPDQKVIPDMTTSDLSPFPQPTRRLK